MSKMYLTCMNSQCRNRLQCWKCYQQQANHQNKLMD